MGLGEVENALQSLEGWPRVIGMMGGEPTAHPDFEAICELYQKYFPREQCGLWTSGGKGFEKHKELITKTFRTILYNDHSETGKHQPWMIASEEIIPDEKLRNELIDNCWIQKMWSPSINPKGAFFCEIAAVFDLLFDMGGGYPTEKDWWRKDVTDFQDQREKYCGLCSMGIPFADVPNDSPVDYVSRKNLQRLERIGSPWVLEGKRCSVEIIEHVVSRTDIEKILADEKYAPWEYLGEKGIRDKDSCVRGGYAKERYLQPLG